MKNEFIKSQPLVTKIRINVKFSSFRLLALITFLLSPQICLFAQDSLVDANFNVSIRTNSFSAKSVDNLVTQPDDKILASGDFNTFNGQSVSKLVRLTSNGTLDTTFNNNLLSVSSGIPNINLQNDGKIILSSANLILNGQTQTTKKIIRLHSNGTIDNTFNYFLDTPFNRVAVDASNKIIISGLFQVNENGTTVTRYLIRLNYDGSHDQSFKYESDNRVEQLAYQGNKIITLRYINFKNQTYSVINRANEDGSNDLSFPSFVRQGISIDRIAIQPDHGIIVKSNNQLYRLNPDGTVDSNFQTLNASITDFKLSINGTIVFWTFNNPMGGVTRIRRLLANGAIDPGFNSFDFPFSSFASIAFQSDGSSVIGDIVIGGPIEILTSNRFMRLLSNGTQDQNFNPNGIGFLYRRPGQVRSTIVQSDNKILIGGNFNSVNDVIRNNLVRLNSDASVDSSFQINTTATGNYFSLINDIYQIKMQADGKLIVSGDFYYFVNGISKRNIVRLLPNGEIDSSFNLSTVIPALHAPIGAGQNRIDFQSDEKLLVGSSRDVNISLMTPLRLNPNGVLDSSFNVNLFSSQNSVFIMDISVQPNNKIIVGGRYSSYSINGSVTKSFLIRLNSDGNIDSSFSVPEELNKEFSTFKILPDGKILAAVLDGVFTPTLSSKIYRLNSDGSLDESFNCGTGANGRTNSLLVLPNGKIMVGGKFTAFNGTYRNNLAKLNEDGSLDSTQYNFDEEIYCLTLDNSGGVLVSGLFSTLAAGDGQIFSRSHLARLIGQTRPNRTRLDFDGDGQADLALLNLTSGHWSVRLSESNNSVITHFGTNGDKPAAADFDGDGKTDVAVFRPAEGTWYLLQSNLGFRAVRCGSHGDNPVPADYDGDGSGDIAVFRPSSGMWFVLQSENNQMFSTQFGQTGDYPLADTDFDGDSRADIAVFRPANSTFYWLASGSQNSFRTLTFGQSGDLPTLGDYNGDGKTDFCVFRPSNGVWYQYLSNSSSGFEFSAVNFGSTGDAPVPADYNGDGKTDIAVRRGSNWNLLLSGQGFRGATYGNSSDFAIAATYLP